jgi:hypothetical protein
MKTEAWREEYLGYEMESRDVNLVESEGLSQVGILNVLYRNTQAKVIWRLRVALLPEIMMRTN